MIAALLEAFHQEKEGSVRFTILAQLGRALPENKTVAAEVLKARRSDPNQDVRDAAANLNLSHGL